MISLMRKSVTIQRDMQSQLKTWNLLRYCCCRFSLPTSLAKNGKIKAIAGNKLTQVEGTKLRAQGIIVMKRAMRESN